MHAIAIPLTAFITAIAFDWRIPQYFSQQLYCKTSKVKIEDGRCARLGDINTGCNDAVF